MGGLDSYVQTLWLFRTSVFCCGGAPAPAENESKHSVGVGISDRRFRGIVTENIKFRRKAAPLSTQPCRQRSEALEGRVNELQRIERTRSCSHPNVDKTRSRPRTSLSIEIVCCSSHCRLLGLTTAAINKLRHYLARNRAAFKGLSHLQLATSFQDAVVHIRRSKDPWTLFSSGLRGEIIIVEALGVS